MLTSARPILIAATIATSALLTGSSHTEALTSVVTPYIQKTIDNLSNEELILSLIAHTLGVYFKESDLDNKRKNLYASIHEKVNIEPYLYLALYARAESLCINKEQEALFSIIKGPKAGQADRCDLPTSAKSLIQFYVSSLSFNDCMTELLGVHSERCIPDVNNNNISETLNNWFNLNPAFAYTILHNEFMHRVNAHGSPEEKGWAHFFATPDKVTALVQAIDAYETTY